MYVNDKITDFYKMPPNSWRADDEDLKYYSGEMAIIWSIFRGETDFQYWMLSDFVRNITAKNKKEEVEIELVKNLLKSYHTEFTIEEPKNFQTLEIAQRRISDVFLRWENILLDFTHTENLLYGFLVLSYSLLRIFDNVKPILIPEGCTKRYSKEEQEYLDIICEMAYLNYKYARHLAEYDEHDAHIEQQYNDMLNRAYELVPTGDIVNSLFAIQAIDAFFKDPNETTSKKINQIQKRLKGRNVIKNVLTLNHHGEIELGNISWGWQYLPRVQISYETDFEEIEAIRPKDCREPSDCQGLINMLFNTPAMIGVKTSEGNTLYWLISLLGDSFEQKREVETINEALNKHIKLNQELVRNLSHSSANYLNSDRLAQTGIGLHEADENNPTLEKMHMEGLALILQSEQEMFLSRQLNSLVWRCSANVEVLEQQIRGSILKDRGCSIMTPFEFALKTVLSRVLFREEDLRSTFIRNKINMSKTQWNLLKSSFMTDIMIERKNEEGLVLSWWENNLGEISVSASSIWENLRLAKEKAFCDLIIEIVTEQMLNALSHGDITQPITFEFGQADEFKGRPRWGYISCENLIGDKYPGGRGVGISTLNETMLLLNSNKKGIEITDKGDIFESKVWILASLTRAL